MTKNMISREEAIKKLKEYWGSDKLVFRVHLLKNDTNNK